MNLVLNDIRSNLKWKPPFNRCYTRAVFYWLGALAAVLLENDIGSIDPGAVAELVIFTPIAVWVLAEVSRQLRRHLNTLALAAAPDLEFSSRGLLALHAIRSLLIVAEVATALAIAVMLVNLVGHS